MTVALFIVLTASIVVAWRLAFAGRWSLTARDALVYTGLASACQIVLTEVTLGAAGLLNRPALAALNGAIAGGLICLRLFGRTRRPPAPSPATLSAVSWLREVGTAANIVLCLLLMLLSAWLVVAAWFLPARTPDDLVYHLPALYQFVQDERISLLPLALRESFALPFNADFLVLWPLVFLHLNTFDDLVQFAVALWGIGVLYCLARCLGARRADAVFVAMLFLFTPVVMGQAGSAYVDLTFAVVHLALLYAAVRYAQTGILTHLVVAGFATGFLLGTKYTALPFVAALQPLLMLRLWRDRQSASSVGRYAIYWVAAVPLCLYWYARNFIELGHPLYPFTLDITGLKTIPGTFYAAIVPTNLPSLLSIFMTRPEELAYYMFSDPGLWRLQGGFGVIFWGLGIPALIYAGYCAVRAARARALVPLLFWMQVPVAFAIIFTQENLELIEYDQRYILIVVALGLLAIPPCLELFRAQLRSAAPVVQAVCVATAAISVIGLARFEQPLFGIRHAVDDLIAGRQTSQYRYLAEYAGSFLPFSAVWDPLDYLTHGTGGWTIYVAGVWDGYYTAPAFGTGLQNRIWNFQLPPRPAPDAYLYLTYNDRRDLSYLGQRIDPGALWQSGTSELVAMYPGGAQLWITRERLAQPGVAARLAEYYRQVASPEIERMAAVAGKLSRDGVVIAAPFAGYALKYLFMTGRLATPVRLLPDEYIVPEARRSRASRIITLGAPLPGFASTQIAQIDTPDRVPLTIFENARSE